MCMVICMSAKSSSVTSAESEHSVSEYFLDNPRMIGSMFAILLMLSQVGNVAAGSGATISGP